MSFFLHKQYLMITETPKAVVGRIIQNPKDHRFLKIVREGPQHLVLTDGRTNMIFKTYQIRQPATLQYLHIRKSLCHEALLQIHKIEVQTQISHSSKLIDQEITCGILFEKYQKTLEQSLKEMSQFSTEEIFSTLDPIKEVLDHMIAHNYDPGHLNLQSIVCSQSYQIKFMDSYLRKACIEQLNRPDFKTVLYEEFTALMFNLLFPSQIHIKSWKSRYEIAEKKLKMKELKYFQELYLKFAPSFFKTTKQKKIKKRDEKMTDYSECKRSKRLTTKQTAESHLRWQEGKENKIIQ